MLGIWALAPNTFMTSTKPSPQPYGFFFFTFSGEVGKAISLPTLSYFSPFVPWGWELEKECLLGVVAHAFNPSTWEAEAGGFPSSRPAWSTKWVPGQPWLHRETLSPKTKKKNKKKQQKKKEDITWTDVTGGCAEHLLLSLSKVIIWEQDHKATCFVLFLRHKVKFTWPNPLNSFNSL